MAGEDDLPDLSPPDLPPEVLAKAEAALANLNDRYIGWAEADARRLRACLDEIRAAGPQGASALPRLFTISHDMKGQAATFGYPLVSELGSRLCRLIDGKPPLTDETLNRLRSLVDGMCQVIGDRLEGDGGEEGRRLLDQN
jgi:hypothetical protein